MKKKNSTLKKTISFILIFSFLTQNTIIFANSSKTNLETIDTQEELEDSDNDEIKEEINLNDSVDLFFDGESNESNSSSIAPFWFVTNPPNFDDSEPGSYADKEVTYIKTVEDFLNIKNNSIGNYKLLNDIDFRNAKLSRMEIDFKGILDGNNFTLKNIKMDASDSDATMGIFKSSENSIIKNINFESIEFLTTYTGNFVSGNSGGLIASNATYSTFENISISNVNVNYSREFGLLASSLIYCNLYDITIKNVNMYNTLGGGAHLASQSYNSRFKKITIDKAKFILFNKSDVVFGAAIGLVSSKYDDFENIEITNSGMEYIDNSGDKTRGHCSLEIGGLAGSIENGKLNNILIDKLDIPNANGAGALSCSIRDSEVNKLNIKNISLGAIHSFRSSGIVSGSIVNTNINNLNTSGQNFIEIDIDFKQGSCFGSIGGEIYNSTISNSFVKVNNIYNTTNDESTAGIIAGSMSGSEINNSLFIVQTDSKNGLFKTSTNNIINNTYFDNDIENMSNPPSEYSRTTAELKNENTFVDWDFINVWEIDEGKSYPTLKWLNEGSTTPPIVDNDMKGKGTWEEPYEVKSTNHFNQIGNDLSAYYILQDDIDFENETINTIGTEEKAFTGTFDGNGYTLSNMRIGEDYSFDSVALFLNVDGGEIKNIVFDNVKIGGNFINDDLIDAAYSTNKSTQTRWGVNLSHIVALFGVIRNSTLSNISVNDINVGISWNIVGGLVGYSYNSTIENCSVLSGKVVSMETSAGASLVGIVEGETVVTECYTSMDIFNSYGLPTGMIGRMVADDTTNIIMENCYSNDRIGAGFSGYGDVVHSLIGSNSLGIRENINVTIKNCYSTSRIVNDPSGSLTDVKLAPEEVNIINSYYLGRETSEQLKQKATFKNWDFDNVWSIEEGKRQPHFKEYNNYAFYINMMGVKYDDKIITEVNEDTRLPYVAKVNNLKFINGKMYLDFDFKLDNKKIGFSTSGEIFKGNLLHNSIKYMTIFEETKDLEILDFSIYQKIPEDRLFNVNKIKLSLKPVIVIVIYDNQTDLTYEFQSSIDSDLLQYCEKNSITLSEASTDKVAKVHDYEIWDNNYTYRNEFEFIYDWSNEESNDNIGTFEESSLDGFKINPEGLEQVNHPRTEHFKDREENTRFSGEVITTAYRVLNEVGDHLVYFVDCNFTPEKYPGTWLFSKIYHKASFKEARIETTIIGKNNNDPSQVIRVDEKGFHENTKTDGTPLEVFINPNYTLKVKEKNSEGKEVIKDKNFGVLSVTAKMNVNKEKDVIAVGHHVKDFYIRVTSNKKIQYPYGQNVKAIALLQNTNKTKTTIQIDQNVLGYN